MKFLFLTLAVAMPFAAMAVDYSRCNFPFEVQVDPEGKVTPNAWLEASNISTEGNRTTMTLRPKQQSGGGIIISGGAPTRIVIERDDQGRIVSMTSGGERPSDATIRQYRQMQTGGYVAGSQGGFGLPGGYGGGGYNVGGLGLGFLVPVRRSGSTEMVRADQLTDSDLNQIGVRGIKATELRSGAQEWSRNSKTQSALRQLQTYSQNNFPFNIPVGTSHQYTFVEGACMPDKISSMTYSSATDRVESQTYYDREDCQHVKTGWERHSAKVNECRNYDSNEISVEYNRLVADGHIQPMQGGLWGGSQGGYVGGMVGGGVGGYGGMGAGSGSGYGGGYMSYNPYMGIGGFGGSPKENLERNYQMCQMYERSWNQGGVVGGYQGGSAGGSSGSAIQY